MPIQRDQTTAAAIAANTNGIALSQTLAAAGPVMLNGGLVH